MLSRYLLVAGMAISAGAAFGAERHLGPHVHGQATVDIAVEGRTLSVDVSLPGHDAVGFEHPPSDAGEQSALAKATAILQAGTWFAPTGAAACSLERAKVSPVGYAGATEPGQHAQFNATYRSGCDDAASLDAVDVRLAQAFPSLQQVVVNVLTDAGASQRVLSPADTHVALKP